MGHGRAAPKVAWADGPAEPRVPLPGELHVWRVVLSEVRKDMGRFEGLLSEDELARMRRFMAESDRGRFAAGRGALRILLGGYLGVPPRPLEFAAEPGGRPLLADASLHRRLRFNVSHSGDLVLLAFASGMDVGVDVESLGRKVDFPQMAAHVFSPEDQAAVAAAPESERMFEFMTRWTCKEAAVKSTGEGFSVPLESVRLEFSPGKDSAVVPAKGGGSVGLSLVRFTPLDGYVAAVASLPANAIPKGGRDARPPDLTASLPAAPPPKMRYWRLAAAA